MKIISLPSPIYASYQDGDKTVNVKLTSVMFGTWVGITENGDYVYNIDWKHIRADG